jgi:hypothetical protein
MFSSRAGVTSPVTLLTIVTIGMASAALLVSVVAWTGTGGIVGNAGASGTNGPPGANGNPGSSTSWGTLTLAFSLTGKATGITIASSTCASEGHGAYACQISVVSTAAIEQKLTGLSYTQSTSLYYAGADPTLGSVMIPGGGATTTFTLWFQAVQYTGNTGVTVTLFIVPASTPA